MNQELSQLLQVCNNIYPLSKSAIEDIYKNINLVKFKKNSFILKEGQVCTKMYFMIQGLSKSYFYRDGKEGITWIAMENSMFTNFRSFVMKQPSLENLIALEDCTCYEIEFDKLEEIYNNHPSALQLGKKIIELHFIRHDEHLFDILYSPVELRFDKFLQHFPGLLNRMMLKDVAYFLAITPETLSRLLKRKKEKGEIFNGSNL